MLVFGKVSFKVALNLSFVKGVPPAMQKLMYKGLMKDEQTLDQLKVQPNAKIVLIGSTIDDIVTVNEKPKGDKEKVDDSPSAAASTEPLSKQKVRQFLSPRFSQLVERF